MKIATPILLLLPLLDLTLLVPMSRAFGLWLLLWLALSALTGVILLRLARKSVERVSGGRMSGLGFHLMLDHQRTVLAGILFIWPGILSDMAAVTVLLTAPPAMVRANCEYPLDLRGRRRR